MGERGAGRHELCPDGERGGACDPMPPSIEASAIHVYSLLMHTGARHSTCIMDG